ncbi:hypothetical protein RvY_13708-2 [Ramazzottius varieornatus]|uniref:Uncharacterized protein n=1 Tax=Ramazzottius varieornatus TaxID=947166 RepID=A0A1D1VXC5_RAMVA|nr:hypothetical protein RvY_13708-2 [Ramazzottius varieornatus]
MDQRGRLLGVLNLDTLGNRTTMGFSPEETEFHESVLRAYCKGFLQLDLRRRTAEALTVGLPWFGKRLPLIVDVQLYFVEPDEEQESPCLRKVASSMGTGATIVHPRPPACRKTDPGFNQRLVTCTVTAESVKEKVHNEKHLTTAIRDPENFSAVVLDITFGRTWPEGEVEKDLVNLLAVCQQTYDEMHKAEDPEEPIAKLIIEKEMPHLQHRFIFGRLLLTECRQICSQVPATILAEVRAIFKPTMIHLKVLRAILTSLYPVESEKGDFEDWNKCKDCVRLELLRLISEYDPTSLLTETTYQTIYNALHGCRSDERDGSN